MNNKDRQLTLESKMYRTKTFGKCDYCNHCFAKYKGCIATSKTRSKSLLCVKAECRMKKIPFQLREVIERPSVRWRLYGLSKRD